MRNAHNDELMRTRQILKIVRANVQLDHVQEMKIIAALNAEGVERAGRSARAKSITFAAALAGIFSIIAILVALFTDSIEFVRSSNLLPGVTSAHAQTMGAAGASPKPEITWLIPWIVILLMAVMAAAFLLSLVILMFTKDTPENQARLKAASDVVKTFGGFFTGIATTLIS